MDDLVDFFDRTIEEPKVSIDKLYDASIEKDDIRERLDGKV